LIGALLIAGSAPCGFARDHEFRAVVREIEAHYHARRSARFAMWLAGAAVRVTRPEGVKSLKIAVFEDQNFSAVADDADFENVIRGALENAWQPLARVWSNRSGERSHVYARESGGDIGLFIVSIEPDEAVVMEVKISQEKFATMLDEPRDIASSLTKDRRENEDAAAMPGQASDRTSSLVEADSATVPYP